jgi:hypothetical protein
MSRKADVAKVEYHAGSRYFTSPGNPGNHPKIDVTVHYKDGSTQSRSYLSPDAYLDSNAARHAAEAEARQMARASGHAYTPPREWEPDPNDYAGAGDYTYTPTPTQRSATRTRKQSTDGGPRWVWVLAFFVLMGAMLLCSAAGSM